MSNVSTDQLFDEYLARLRVAAAALPADQGAEIVDEISEHLAEARAAGEVDTEVGARNVLERLGEPSAIVGAMVVERDSEVKWERPIPFRELFAAFFMTFGSVILVVGWVIGVVLLWSSHRLSRGYKILATVVFPLGPLALATLLPQIAYGTCPAIRPRSEMYSRECLQFGISPLVFGMLWCAAVIFPFMIALFVVRQALRVAKTEPAQPVPKPTRIWGPLEIISTASLTAGWLLFPGINVVAGLGCAWASKAWTKREKTIATSIVLLSIVPVVLLGLAALSNDVLGSF